MNTEQKSPRSRFSPKVIFVILLSASVVLFSGLYLFRSVFSGNVLESIESGEFRFELCGDASLSEIRVYRNDKRTATVKTSSVGGAETHYGVTVADLSFDGFPDLLVVRGVDGTDVRCDAWVWNNATGTFRSAEALAGVKNPTLNEEYGAVLSTLTEQRDAGEDANGAYYENVERISVYTAVNGTIVEFARYEFVYYTRSDIYAYLVYRFDSDAGALSTFSEDVWLSPVDAEGFSLSDMVHDDLAQHRTDYPNAAPLS